MNYYFEPVNLKQWNMFEKVKSAGHVETFLATKIMSLGDKMLLYVGKQVPHVGPGIYAVGEIISAPYILRNSPTDYCNNKTSVDVRIDSIQYENPIVPGELCKKIFRQFRSVHKISDEGVTFFLEYTSTGDIRWPDEIIETGETCYEGSKSTIVVNAYERNLEARKKCISEHGAVCKICGFDFGKIYGKEFAGKIHVHHIKPLHEVNAQYCVDPINDLIPVCPNCHMVLHSKSDGTFTAEEVRQMRKRNMNLKLKDYAKRKFMSPKVDSELAYFDTATVLNDMSVSFYSYYRECSKQLIELPSSECNSDLAKGLWGAIKRAIIDTIMHQAIAVEAYLNWYCYQNFGGDEFYEDDDQNRFSAKDKLKLIFYAYEHDNINCKELSQMDELFKKRDAIIHYKTTGIDDRNTSIDDFIQHLDKQIGFLEKDLDAHAGVYDAIIRLIASVDGTGETLSEKEYNRQEEELRRNINEMMSKVGIVIDDKVCD